MSTYNTSEIKYKIDTAIQFAMYNSKDSENKEECWKALLDAQSRLYEQFGLED